MKRALIIVVDGADMRSTSLVQSAVKRLAEDWWHNLSSTWIVISDHQPSWWNERLSAIFGLEGSMMVLELPRDPDERLYSGIVRFPGADEWFRKVYRGNVYEDPWGPAAITTGDTDDEPPF